MPELPEYIASHKGDAARMVFKLVRVALPVPQCMTTADVAITYGGETYLPMAGLKVGGIRVSEADQSAVAANVTIGNADGTWGYMWASLSPTDRHPEITVADAWMDPAEPWLGPQGVRTLLAGIVESTTWGATDITLTVGPSRDMRSETLPFRDLSTRCTVRRFKGAQCGYAGSEPVCDRAYPTCVAFGNAARFGGLRYLPQQSPAVAIMTNAQGTLVTLEFDRGE